MLGADTFILSRIFSPEVKFASEKADHGASEIRRR
jgi:hypothetical protein